MRVAGEGKPVSSREFGKGGVSGTCDASMSFDMLIATGSLSSLLSEVREMSPLGRGEPVSQVVRNAGFSVTTRNPLVQVDPIPGSFGLGLGGTGVSFGCDITSARPEGRVERGSQFLLLN